MRARVCARVRAECLERVGPACARLPMISGDPRHVAAAFSISLRWAGSESPRNSWVKLQRLKCARGIRFMLCTCARFFGTIVRGENSELGLASKFGIEVKNRMILYGGIIVDYGYFFK